MPPGSMPLTRRRKRKPVDTGPTITVADYYRHRLTRVPYDPTPPTVENYLRYATP